MRLHVWVDVLIHLSSKWLLFDVTFTKKSSVSAIYHTTPLYTDLLLTPSTYLCKDCYNCVLELMRSTDNEFTTDNEGIDNVVNKDEDFLPSIRIRNIRKKRTSWSSPGSRLLANSDFVAIGAMECPDPRLVWTSVCARAKRGWHLEPRSVSPGNSRNALRASRARESDAAA